MKTLLNKLTSELVWTLGPMMVAVLAFLAWEYWPAYQRVNTFLAAQEAGPPTQTTDDSLGGLLNEEIPTKTRRRVPSSLN